MKSTYFHLGFTAYFLLAMAEMILCQCPWHRDIQELQSSCLCAYNLRQELSVQCDQVNFSKLFQALEQYAASITIDLLYVNNSTLTELKNDSFLKLTMHNIQLSGCKIKNIQARAFRGQENSLINLNLQENELTQVPVEALKNLKTLSLLDLSKNKITKIPDGAFATLNLSTLKLSDNNVSLAPFALRGLENSLKNLNLKGTKQKRIPEAVRNLKMLAFLDLAQNALRELPGPAIGLMEGLDSLTALNLERNLIQNIGPKAFSGVNDTLSSLSLLNNLITEFPTGAMNTMSELRVLDIGFNLLTELPTNAFIGNPSLTLLALDGNPLPTVPKESLIHLNRTLRGLSLGGRFLHCDCKLRWIAEWIRRGDLQVTSRERNPQFCGTPTNLKDRGFYSIEPKELVCAKEENELKNGVAIIEKADLDDVIKPNPKPAERDNLPGSGIVQEYVPPATYKPISATKKQSTEKPQPVRTNSPNWSPTRTPTTPLLPPNTYSVPTQDVSRETTEATSVTSTTPTRQPSSTTAQSTTAMATSTSALTTTTIKASTSPPQTSSSLLPPPPPPLPKTTRKVPHVNKVSPTSWRSSQRPPLVMAYPPRTRPFLEDKEVMVKNAYRQDNSVIIQWDSETANILGFRVVYRLFGDKSFKQGPPLEASEREFKIKNVPLQECIVVCVISLEEVNVTPDTVPYSQCREVRTVTSPAGNMDKITVAASAAICGTIVIAVVVFVVASKRRSRKLETLHPTKQGVPVTALPTQCCPGFTPNAGGPLSSLAALNSFGNHKDWDQVSVYSNRSIPRPQIYHIERQGSLNARCSADDLRSHISHASHFSTKGFKQPRSIADGQSQHSFSNHSTRYLAGSNGFASNLVNHRPELRQSRQSLASLTDRISRMSYPTSHVQQHSRHRSSSRQRSDPALGRPGSRYSTAGSTHTLNNYCENSDNWTDHDMEIYMARNPTTRNGFVPL